MLLRERRAEGEEFVAAGIAAEGGKAAEAAEEGGPARNVLGSDTLQVGAAAKATVGVERDAKRGGARVKAGFAGFAAPGQNVRGTEKIVHHRASLGAAYFAGLANRTSKWQGCGLCNRRAQLRTA